MWYLSESSRYTFQQFSKLLPSLGQNRPFKGRQKKKDSWSKVQSFSQSSCHSDNWASTHYVCFFSCNFIYLFVFGFLWQWSESHETMFWGAILKKATANNVPISHSHILNRHSQTHTHLQRVNSHSCPLFISVTLSLPACDAFGDICTL